MRHGIEARNVLKFCINIPLSCNYYSAEVYKGPKLLEHVCEVDS